MENYNRGDDNNLASSQHITIEGSSSPGERYGGLVPKKKPLISKPDHERAFFDSADWALYKQGATTQKSPVVVESLRPKLKRTPHQQLPPRRPACTSTGGDNYVN